MILSRPETAKAFEELLAALDAEARELNQLGGKIAYQGIPSKAPYVLKLSSERAQLRDHIQLIYEKWKQSQPEGLSELTAPPPDPPADPMLSSSADVSGPLLSIGAAARKVGVKTEQIREWIYAGYLPAKQSPSGKWQVSGPELIKCFRTFGSR